MKILVSELKKLIADILKESDLAGIPYGQNWQTLDNNPISWELYPGMTIDHWPEADRGYYIKIIVDDDDSLSTPGRIFSTQEDAMAYGRRKAEEIKRHLMNQTDVPAKAINLVNIDSKNFDNSY
mgnify:CR=1 FL=1